MKKLYFALLLIVALFLAACSMDAPGSEKSDSKKESTGSKGDYKIGLSVSTLNNPFFVTLSDGAEAKADELGATVTVVDAQDNASKQASDVEDLIQQGVDLIIINPVDSQAVVSSVESANAANIPVVTVDRSSEGGEVVAHIASDNVAGGELAGEYLLELAGEGAAVVELEGIAGSSAARDRGQGFNNVADGKLDVVAKQTANFNRAEGLTVMENILQSNPDIKGVFAHNDEMALGALEAIEAAGKDIIVIGFDATDDAVKSVENGKLAGTIAQKPEQIGEKAMEAAIKALNGEEVEASIPVDLELIKK
ncbi:MULTISPECIES: ribose ABC transporter substrate-binding protein RbsB [Psychrobacillus]|uniref:Ribose ABC transporter substrate-binding protein RbsB n=1 Tax=Psychrobacillus faecigallinarum TaxID=2762235 RepID=A0ABR8RDM5_9BACI|nr:MULTISPECIES: ribose ABC transporter substrate-binding protein RbsB [Psychrobacillus]MBD7945896.1 ribose ABC transporter substrate-binding protein RbsB [Psychrobacillus faecigallinarum]QEY22144.1 ribose ABC transporter substrate-binding protein RbsB [Psychrobacillus sp. AK 1817]QGM29027.1 ribose ABC transporter substrate-binding protein RbsB [Bacillus sp. N3536]